MTDFPVASRTAAYHARIVAMIGQRFCRLTVLGIVSELINGRLYLLARCDCGVTKQILPRHLKSGGTRSCGCLSVEVATERVRTHSMSKTPIYGRWQRMLYRCDSQKCSQYKWYGARGISVCDRWRIFEHFLADVGQPPTKKHELDRIDNNGNYELGNVRWVSHQENARNTRSTRFVTIDGVTQCIAEWAAITGHHQRSITKRLDRGMNPKEAVFGSFTRAKKRVP